MNKLSSATNRTIANLFLFLMGFFLIWEWLRPIEQLTNTGNLIVFILFLIVSLAISYFRLHPILSGFLKIIFILFVLQWLYYDNSFFTFSWIGSFSSEFILNVSLLFDMNLPDLTNMFKSLLFFILLWLMSYLIDYWLINKRKIFTFFLLTMVYITVLDTFTLYSANWAIVRTLAIGFTSMGMLTYLRLRDKEGLVQNYTMLFKWMGPLLVFVSVSILIGYISPKAEPIWPDPVPFIQAMGDKGGEGEGDGTGAQRVGYSVDDSRLGGDFEPDDTVVFQAEVESSHYWKVETKDTYTGKGWIQSEEALALSNENFERIDRAGNIPFVSFEEGETVNTLESSSRVRFVDPFSYMLYPLGVTDISSLDASMTIEQGNERIVLDYPIESYDVNFRKPEYSLTALTSANMEQFANENPEFAERYLQLPDSLPQRVRDLAVEITKDEDNPYSRARAIERYFSNNGYVYSQLDVAIPEEDEDYVDQFLFETKLGYCDNYSTSMVTLLRSIGIPARWVKGFTEGELVRSTVESSVYKVTNNNAHSWVEAYFPEVGWVSFEPTQGFTNENTILNDVQNETNTQETEEETQQQEEEEPNSPEQEQEVDSTEQPQSQTMSQWWNSVLETSKNNWHWIAVGLLGLFLCFFLIFKTRYKWLPRYYIWKYRTKNADEDFPKAYLLLLQSLKMAGMYKQDNITLREYAKYIDHVLETTEMAILTSKYEELLYSGQRKNVRWNELKELWENLIKKTTA